MTEEQLKDLKEDFLAWTGGWPPEDSGQVTTYVDVSMPFDLDEHEATTALLQWMREVNNGPD